MREDDYTGSRIEDGTDELADLHPYIDPDAEDDPDVWAEELWHTSHDVYEVNLQRIAVGATSLEAVFIQLKNYVAELDRMVAEGWELADAFEDGYGVAILERDDWLIEKE